MAKYDRKIILGISDIHSGFKYGLFSPDTVTSDSKGNVTHLKPPSDIEETSQFIYDAFTWGIEETVKLAGKDEIIPFFDGDITHGNKHISEQISTKIGQQLDIAFYNILPIASLKNVKMMRFAGGTPAHVFGEMTAEELVVSRLSERFPRKNFKVTLHGMLSVAGISIDYAHHGPTPGRRNWLSGNEATLYLKSLMMSELDAGCRPPDLVLRGHYHVYTKSWARVVRNGIEYESWLVILPSLAGLGDFGNMVTRSAPRVGLGVVAFEIINGRVYATHPYIQTLDVRLLEDYDQENITQ